MNRVTRVVSSAVFLLGIGVAVSGCVVQPANPYPPVPAARVEVIPPRPQPNLIWQPGHYQWNGRVYAWIPGRYVNRAPGGRWVPGHWVWFNGRHVWVAAHWQ